MSDEPTRRRRGPAGAELVAQRPRAEGVCLVCGGPLAGYAGKKFCGVRCQVADYRRRQREQLAASPPRPIPDPFRAE